MELKGAPVALGVTALVILLSLSEVESATRLCLFNCLPKSCRWKTKVGFGVPWIYFTSDKNKLAENIVEFLFDVLPEDFLENTLDIPPGEMFLNLFGYVCWGKGTVTGLKSIKKIGMDADPQEDGSLTVDIRFKITDLIFEPEICGHQHIAAITPGKKVPITQVFKCRLVAGSVLSRVTFEVKSTKMDEILSMIKDKQCFISITDYKFLNLEELGVETLSEGTTTGDVQTIWRRCLTFIGKGIEKAALDISINILLPEIRRSYSKLILTYMYVVLESKDAVVCKHQLLVDLIENLDTKLRDVYKEIKLKELSNNAEITRWSTFTQTFTSNYEDVCVNYPQTKPGVEETQQPNPEPKPEEEKEKKKKKDKSGKT